MNYLYEYAYIKKNFFTGIAMALIINQLMAWMVTSVFKFFKKKNNKAKAAEEQHFSLVLRKKDLVKLEMAYRHPWEKLKPFIDTYYLNNLLEKPDNYIIQEQFDIQGQNQSIGHTRDVKLIIHQPMNPPEDFIQKQISSPKHPLEEQAPPRVPNHPDINDLDEKIFGAKFQLKRSLSFSYHKGGISNKRKLALLFMNDKEKFQYEKLTSGKTRGINESQSVHNERTDPKFYAGKNISEFSLIDSEKDALEWEQQLDG